MIGLLACAGEAAAPVPHVAPAPVVVAAPAPPAEPPPPPPAAPPKPGEGSAIDPWRSALASLSPADPTRATSLVDARIAARATQNAGIVAARYALVAAVLGGESGAPAWSRLRTTEEALLRDERTFIWAWFDAVGSVPAGRADELILPAFAAMREDVRLELPRDTAGELEATAALGAVRYRLAGSALAVDEAWEVARAATERLDDRSVADRALAALGAALIHFQGEKVAQLGWLRAQLGPAGWNKLARSWDIAQALGALTIGSSPLDPGSLAGNVLSGEAGAVDPVNEHQAATRRAWEVPAK